MLNKDQNLLSEITIFNKYSKFLKSENRRESWTEIVTRYLTMMENKYPKLKNQIWENGKHILDKKILPSMRALQFAGPAIDRNPARIYNCAYMPIDDYRAFSETMFLLLGGTGVGYSVQFHHIDKLPEIKLPVKTKRYLVGDSIEGWADAVKMLMKAYFTGQPKPNFDFRDIREKGALLLTAGGKAPGPEPLKLCLAHIEAILNRKKTGEKLTSLEIHDILCHIANAVLAGGIRRAAMIALFSFDDEEMLACKSGNWWELNEQRGRANNSAVIGRNRITSEEFLDVFQ
jgi:ribonucleoside-diphosphate reductase alpha chain